MICFTYFCQKNCSPFRACPIMTPFLCKLAPPPPKTIFIQDYLTYFIGNQPKKTKVGIVCGPKFGPNLVQYCEKTKKPLYFNVFCNILHEVYIYKQEVVFIEIPE